MHRTIKICLLSMLLIGWGSSISSAYASKVGEADSIPVAKKQKNVFVKTLLKPLKWIGKNWSAYDPRYSTPSFYNWVGQFQNTSSMEMMHIKQDDMMDLVVRSKWSHKIGPYLGYSFLFYGVTVDLNAMKGTNRRNEFTLSVNSNLVNIDLIRRRTGGDFMFKKWGIGPLGDVMDPNNIINEDDGDVDLGHIRLSDYNMDVNNDVTGINFNFFTNHKKYSNPAAFSNGAIQLRSVGSPILGFGYIHQKISMPFGNVLSFLGASALQETDGSPSLTDEEYQSIFDDYEHDKLKKGKEFTDALEDVINNHMDAMVFNPDNALANSLIFNSLPSTIKISDLHLQLGYAYNLVFSRRLLLGVSAIFSPGMKRITADSSDSYGGRLAEEMGKDVFNQIFETNNSYMQQHTNVGFNVYGRASLTYNFNRWRAGLNANINYSRYHAQGLTIEDGYGALTAYVGYCFGRKKQYRWNGKDREAYITAALTKSQIEAMHDTVPESNVQKGDTYEADYGKTKYHTDNFYFDIPNSDIVKGPDGTYGSFQVEDGNVAEGNDTEKRLVKGAMFYMDKDGHVGITAGHRAGFRPSNWLKSQLKLRQMPTNWYPEMLHYALRGKLTIYLRNYKFGTKKPVKVVLDDFILAHGKETKNFYLIGNKNFYSHSAYSIIGATAINNRMMKVYIESKKNGKHNYMYFNPIMKSGLSWMKYIPGDRAISRVSIPGTHDAGSSSLVESSINSMGHTQNFSILEQMADGVRAFDIRLKKNMKFGHTVACRDGIPEALEGTRKFLQANPSEFVIFMIGSDEGGKWSDEMKYNYKKLIKEYSDIMVDSFNATTKVDEVRGKILVIKRQEDCPYGKLLEFEDNTIFSYDCFHVEDIYKMHKTYKKYKVVEQHLREAYENEDPNKWYITFNSIAWDPRHHKPYYSAWGAMNVRKPMNKALRETIEKKGYNDFGIVFLDFYNDHGDNPYVMKDIIQSNFHLDADDEYIPSEEMRDMMKAVKNE